MVLWVSSTLELQDAVQEAQSAGLQDALLNSSLIYLILSDLIVDLRFPKSRKPAARDDPQILF